MQQSAISFSEAMDHYKTVALLPGGLAADLSREDDNEGHVGFLGGKLTSFIIGQFDVKDNSNITLNNYFMMENTTSSEL